MSNKTNLDLVTHAKRALGEKWGYVWGTFGQVLTAALLASKVNQYPNEVGGYLDFIKSNWLNRRAADCVGLIKSCYWWNDAKDDVVYAANDVSADGMYNAAKEKGAIGGIPEIPGLCLWKTGHIGVYVGGGVVIESAGTKKGVVQTPLKGGTPWTHWLKCPYIGYQESAAAAPIPAPTPEPEPPDPTQGARTVRDDDEAILQLVKADIIADPGYWTTTKTAYVWLSTLLINMANYTLNNPRKGDVWSGDVTAAIARLCEAGVIASPDYWSEAVGKLSNIEHLIMKMAGYVGA
jgi:hypothetical protein